MLCVAQTAKHEVQKVYDLAWDLLEATGQFEDEQLTSSKADSILEGFKRHSKWSRLWRSDQDRVFGELKAHADNQKRTVMVARETLSSAAQGFSELCEKFSFHEASDEESVLFTALKEKALLSISTFQQILTSYGIDAEDIQPAMRVFARTIFKLMQQVMTVSIENGIAKFAEEATTAIDDVLSVGMGSFNELNTAKEMLDEIARIQVEFVSTIEEWEERTTWPSWTSSMRHAKDRVNLLSDAMIRQIQMSNILLDPALGPSLVPDVIMISNDPAEEDKDEEQGLGMMNNTEPGTASATPAQPRSISAKFGADAHEYAIKMAAKAAQRRASTGQAQTLKVYTLGQADNEDFGEGEETAEARPIRRSKRTTKSMQGETAVTSERPKRAKRRS